MPWHIFVYTIFIVYKCSFLTGASLEFCEVVVCSNREARTTARTRGNSQQWLFYQNNTCPLNQGRLRSIFPGGAGLKNHSKAQRSAIFVQNFKFPGDLRRRWVLQCIGLFARYCLLLHMSIESMTRQF